MQDKSIAECSNESILQYFQPSLSYHLIKIFCFVVDHIVCGSVGFVGFLFCYVVHIDSVLSSFAIISLGKRELTALLLLSSCCHVALFVLARLLHPAMCWSAVCE